jgi:DNA-binding MarR family transcriptional regulator
MAAANKDKQDKQEKRAAGAAGSASVAGAGKSAGRFAYEGLARVIHEKARLSILASLATHPGGLLFNDLKALCSLTDGNLSRRLQVLQEAGFVEVWKGFKNNRPQTLVRLTDPGRERFLEYIGVLENVVADAMSAAKQTAKRAVTDALPGAHRVAPG